jgi:threonine dehydrogenase-like Zn-dependent dehydrogenase
MKAVVFRGIGDIRLEDVADPKIQDPNDAIVRITTSAICGTDLHFVRGTMPGCKPGLVLGHEAVGVIEEIGAAVRNLNVGDRVIIPSSIACGACSYCRAGYYGQCDVANPGGKRAGTAFFGGPEDSGSFNGLQAERARVPFANVGLVKLPDDVADDQAILLSDIFPTAWFGAELAEIRPGNTVAVFGCGPVGQLAIASARLQGAGRVFAIERVPSRLAMARAQGAEVLNFETEDPTESLVEFTQGIGVDRAIDAVGVDAVHPHRGPAAAKARKQSQQFDEEVQQVAPKKNPQGDNWVPGDAPSQALSWAVEALAKAGTLSIIGVYTPASRTFPIGEAMNKNLTIKMGNCHHRRYIPELLRLVRTGAVDVARLLTQHESMTSVIEAYQAFDRRDPGWLKVKLDTGATARTVKGNGHEAPAAPL